MKPTLPCELGARVTRTSIARSLRSDQRMREGALVALGCGQPAQVDQIGSHFRPDFNAHDDVTLPAALSGAAHAQGEVTVRHQFGEGGVGQTSTGRSSLLTRRWREMDSNFRF